ncbi:hypothetical protein [Streptomyces sp. NPDC093984]
MNQVVVMVCPSLCGARVAVSLMRAGVIDATAWAGHESAELLALP